MYEKDEKRHGHLSRKQVHFTVLHISSIISVENSDIVESKSGLLACLFEGEGLHQVY